MLSKLKVVNVKMLHGQRDRAIDVSLISKEYGR